MSARLSSLLSRATELTRAEYRILSYLIDNPTQVGKLTIRALAQANFVSTTTIMRLCQKLGFSGYSELVYYCKQLLSTAEKSHQLKSDESEVTEPLFDQFLANYLKTFTLISDEKRHAFVDLINSKNSFFIYGAGFSHIFSEYISKRLQLIGKDAFLSGLSDSKNIFINNASRYTVFIAISRSGETEQVVEKARIAKSIGMKIVAFTRASANPLAELADIHFPIYDDAVNYHCDTIESSSFESNLVLIIDLLLSRAQRF